MTTPTDQPRTNETAQTIDKKAQALGREAEAAANRFATNPAVLEAADTAGRLWGAILLAAGIWLFAAVTLHLDLPNVAWADFWPVILIAFGGLIVLRGATRRP